MTQTEFLTMVSPLQGKMYRLAFSFFRNEDEAKDIVQDVLIKIWEKRESLPQVENVEAWCIRIAKNTILDRLKHNSYRRTSDMAKHNEHPAATNVQELTEMKDIIHTMRRIMNELPEKYRFLIHLREIDGLPYNEISEIMELRIETVKVGISRARHMIRKKLKNLHSYGQR